MPKCNKCGCELIIGKNWNSSSMKNCCYICKKCRKKYTGKWYQKHREEQKEYNLIRYYGITLKQYNTMLEAQSNKCAICGKEFTEDDPPCVDHNHETKEVRTLLCRGCNTALGSVKEDSDIANRLVSYIKEWCE